MISFESLPQSKRLAVLQAAFSCFGKNGYKKTSVADIAAAAGTSKASLFQYFGSKKALYLYLFEFASNKILEEIPEGTDDFFECLQLATRVKMRIMALYPGMYDFLSSLILEKDAAIISNLDACKETYIRDALTGLFGKVNWDKLRPGIDKTMLMNAVTWINEGYLRASIGSKDAETMRRELFAHFELIRKAYYKKEYL